MAYMALLPRYLRRQKFFWIFLTFGPSEGLPRQDASRIAGQRLGFAISK